ncbi:hypothetical protein GCM10009563_27820 [Subtercola frigoramans]
MTRISYPTAPPQMPTTPKTAWTPRPVEALTMSDPCPEHTPKPDEIDPDEGTEPDGTPVENPSG